MTALRLPRVRSAFVGVIATTLVTMWSGYVYAGVITIHFPTDLADTSAPVFHNSTADGFRISPRCHYDTTVQEGSAHGVPGIGWDSSGCGSFPSGFNPAYLGPPSNPIGLYIDDNGLPFGLLSVETFGESYRALSSKGGMVNIPSNFALPPNFNPPPPLHVDFTGPQWRDILWVVFTGDSGSPSHGFNQLVAFVPAPSTFALLGLGVLVLGWHSRSRRP